MFLRIAPELYLKRLLVAGFTQIFELNRNFRNEGLSRRHNPEFTMLEAYWAYADFEKMADLVEGMICNLAENFCGGLKIEHKDEEGNVTKTINLARPWKRARYTDLLKSIDPKWYDYTPEERKARAKELGVDRLVYIDLYEYRLNPVGNSYLWDGVAGANIGIIEADGLAPDEFVYTTNIIERFPDQEGVGRESARREDIERGLLTLFVQRTSWLFYRHIEDKYPDKS
jgi:hypothetical protein